MKTRIIKSAGVLLLALVMTLAMNAQPHRQGQRGMAELDLTEAQSEEITQLRTDHYTSMKPLKAKMAEVKARIFKFRYHLIIQPLRTIFFNVGYGGRFPSGVSGTLLELPELYLIFQC